MSYSKNNLIWIDLEMTGLDTDIDQIIEIATIVTDSQLNILEEGPIIAIFQTDDVLNQMDEWNTRQHNQSGLVERIKTSSYNLAEAESFTLTFLNKLVPKGKSPMCGNSICQDRRFMHRLMPNLEAYFHYRNLDVSTIKEIKNRWAPEHKDYNKQSNHLAMDDIRDSINELLFYREHVFKI
ncbi:MAG: oligoribonuclease [Legionellales bacterium]|nr:oligoribonuclease [Legionellales bacterium]|tara:strand:- start:1773 stop:2315 length:543 start_codon:yes stop_codon:yes gene_type:complete